MPNLIRHILRRKTWKSPYFRHCGGFSFLKVLPKHNRILRNLSYCPLWHAQTKWFFAFFLIRHILRRKTWKSPYFRHCGGFSFLKVLPNHNRIIRKLSYCPLWHAQTKWFFAFLIRHILRRKTWKSPYFRHWGGFSFLKVLPKHNRILRKLSYCPLWHAQTKWFFAFFLFATFWEEKHWSRHILDTAVGFLSWRFCQNITGF